MFKKIASLVLAAGLTVASLTGMGTLPVQAATGTYTSELTGEPISTAIQAQRPIAVMVDNDKRSLPHYSVADADIVYELVNSLVNNRITRLMCVYKDWNNVALIGNIRSTRPTNVMLASELNAVLVHDGGPYYIRPYLKSTKIADLSAGFTRIKNGKAREFTEYVKAGEVKSRLAAAGLSSNYTVAEGNHFNFTPYGTEVNLNVSYPGAAPVNVVSLPYTNTSSQLVYNPATKTYDYYEFGKPAVDATTNKQVSFKNVFIQNCDIVPYDANGYFLYNCVATNQVGYYLTNGYMVPVYWSKTSETGRTIYTDVTGQEILVNTGKSYVTLCPSDTFAAIQFQ